MTGRLYIHIGPPKTATTSLQYAFESIADENLVYGGTFQPRDRNAGSLVDCLLRGIGIDKAPRRERCDAAVEQIRGVIRSGRSVLLSEEMFALSMKTTMQEKLAFLRSRFQGLPVTVILCLRDPRDALPSLYQEIYQGLPFLTKLSFARFCRSRAADCYDYKKIIGLLQELRFDSIRVISFERVCSGELTLRDLFGSPDLPQTPLKLRRANTSKTREGASTRLLAPISLSMLMQTRLYRWLRKGLPFRAGALDEKLSALLGRIRIPGSECRTLSIPGTRADYFQKSYEFACMHLSHVPDDRRDPALRRETAM